MFAHIKNKIELKLMKGIIFSFYGKTPKWAQKVVITAISAFFALLWLNSTYPGLIPENIVHYLLPASGTIAFIAQCIGVKVPDEIAPPVQENQKN